MTPDEWRRAKVLLPDAMRLSPDERRQLLGHEFSEAALVDELLQMLGRYDISTRRFRMDSIPSRELGNGASNGAMAADGVAVVEPLEVTLGPGDQCGRYRVVKLLGSGGMGHVYLADDTDLGGRVALKVLHGAWLRSPDANRRLRDEARRAAALRSHPHVATVFHILDEEVKGERLLILVMEYVEGKAALAYTSRGALPPRRALAWARDVANAVAFAHDRGILHCDLKPGNIQITDDDRAKVLDFGLARLKFEPPDGTQGLVGTPAYMAPEQLLGDEPDEKVDIYSLGVTLFEMLTGRHPYDAETWPDMFVEMQSPERPNASALVAAIPADAAGAIDSILERAMARDPRRRFQSAREFEQALDAAIVLVDRAAPVARVRSRALSVVKAAAGGFAVFLTLGFIASASLDQGLHRSAEFGRASPWSWPGWGVRSLVAPAVFAIVLLVGVVVFAFVCRIAFAVPALQRLFEPPVSRGKGVVHRIMQLPTPVLAQGLLAVQVIVLGISLWYFWPFIDSLINFVTSVGGTIAELRPGRGGMHNIHMWVMSAQSFGFAILWWRLLRLRALRKEPEGQMFIVAAAAVLGISLFFLTVRYRVIYHNESERVLYESHTCYDVGSDGPRTLLFCPRNEPRTVVADTAGIARSGVVENIFSPLDSQ